MSNTFKIFLFLAFLFPTVIFSQISGEVRSELGETLPYVNIYIENTSIGTTTNGDGRYTLKLAPGTYKLYFQYLGYKTAVQKITIGNQPISKDVILREESYAIPEVVISASAEDPAYAIIRKAQAKRKYYQNLKQSYECDAYVRGFNKMTKAPEKIFGIEVGDLDGNLDSTRTGVIYLSESVSKLYALDGDRKEIMFSSKISGNDRGYSFNSAKEMEFEIYDNNIKVNRNIISPIASGAMSYYKYKLEGAHYDENGQLVNKIKVTPKNEFSPTFYGYIYINEDLWNVNSLELGLTKKSLQLDFIDSLVFTQTFIPIEEDKWMPFSNVVTFKIGALGFEVTGNFACVYSNYILDNVDKSIFNREVFKVETNANERNEMYWDSIRPIPLTLEERIDYTRKDSIQIVRESPEYLDSIDREQNKFNAWKILFGYRHQNSTSRTEWSYSSPISGIQLNTIQGFSGKFQLKYDKAYNKNKTQKISAEIKGDYGLTEKVFRPEVMLSYLANRKNNLRLQLAGGQSFSQFNQTEPISNQLNSFMTYFLRRNYLKAYDKKYVTLGMSRNLGALFTGRLSIAFENRSSLSNNYSNSLFYKNEREFTENLIPFEDHKALIFKASLRIKIGEELWSYPDYVYRSGSSWPTIWLHYNKGFKELKSNVDYELIHASIGKSFTVGIWGDMSVLLHGGLFIKQPEYFVDFMHFSGNQTHIANPLNYNRRFLILPYYSHSSDKEFIQFHLEHNFQGAVLGKVPLFKNLGWHLAGGFKYLDTNSQNAYREFHIGIDNLGWKVFRLFRLDAVWSNWDTRLENPGNGSRFGIVVGIKADL